MKYTDKQITDEARRRCIDLLDKTLNKLYEDFLKGIDSYSGPAVPLMKKGAEIALSDISLINKVLLKMRKHGRPCQLIFSDEHGDSYDLINDREIDPEEIINMVLDNIKE